MWVESSTLTKCDLSWRWVSPGKGQFTWRSVTAKTRSSPLLLLPTHQPLSHTKQVPSIHPRPTIPLPPTLIPPIILLSLTLILRTTLRSLTLIPPTILLSLTLILPTILLCLPVPTIPSLSLSHPPYISTLDTPPCLPLPCRTLWQPCPKPVTRLTLHNPRPTLTMTTSTTATVVTTRVAAVSTTMNMWTTAPRVGWLQI